MPSPLNLKAASIVAPAEPQKAVDAAVANPVTGPNAPADPKAQREQFKGNPLQPFKPNTSQQTEGEEKPPHYIAIEFVDKKGNPMAGEAYRIILPDDKVAEGTLDEKGCARVNGIEPGNCKITFPKLEKQAWAPK